MNSVKSIKVSSLTMRNFMSYNDYQLANIDKYKIIFISGVNAQGKSTLTSEAPYFSLFGSALRFSTISKLLSWYYKPENNEPAFSELGLTFECESHTAHLSIKRNIISDPRYELEIKNDLDGIFNGLVNAVKIPDFNNELKRLLDIDQKKFSILYLKSPFSSSIFETDSDLLSSITKAQFINELRSDFKAVVSTLNGDMKNLSGTIEKQNELASSIKAQLESMLDDKERKDSSEKVKELVDKLSELESSLGDVNKNIESYQNDYQRYNDSKNECTALVSKIQTYVSQLETEKQRLQQLTERGKCPTCEQSIGKNLYEVTVKELDEKITKYSGMLNENQDKLTAINAKLNNINSSLTDEQSSQRTINSQLRSLSNMKTQLQSTLDNYDDTKKNNDEVLKRIRNTIMDLNDDLTAISKDFKIIDSINKVMLGKNSEYINKFYDKKIHSFNIVFKSILSKMTKGKYTDVTIKLNNKPTLNGYIEYEALSTSERKFVDLSFVVAYIVYLSTKLKLKTFILDEFFDNYDKENIIHIYSMIFDIADTYNLQLLVTTNLADYIFTYMGDIQGVHVEVLGDTKVGTDEDVAVSDMVSG